MKPKILVIGLDAATMDLIRPWAGAGLLPAIARLMNEGTSSRFLSTPNMHSASAWTSILTGLNPGRHGLFVFSDRDFATGRQVFFKGGDRKGEIISSHLARRGLTSGLLNVPMTYPAECQGGGFTVSGLDAPTLNEKAFCPAELRSELMDRVPDYHFTPSGLGDFMSAGRIATAIGAWMKLIEAQTEAARYVLESRPVDFFMTVYTASDWAGHNLWKYFDNTCGGSESSDTRFPDALLSIYQALDRAIDRLLEYSDDKTQVYVISDHGMGPHTGASYHLAGWLEANGYMVRKNRSRARPSLLGAGRRAARALLPVSLREKIKSGIGDARAERLQSAEKDEFYSSIDWHRTTAYTEPGRHVININLAGRNHQGGVASSDYEKTCRHIIEDLSKWTDSRGVTAVERVSLRDEVYKGPFTERASDLYVHWNPEASLGEPPSEVRARGFWWSGDHRPEGILICKGPGILKSGVRGQGSGVRGIASPHASRESLETVTHHASRPPAVYDLLPTIMYLAGLPVPGNLDGRVIEEACTDEFLTQNPIRTASTGDHKPSQESSLTPSEEEMIEEKLRSLGYL